MTTLVTIPNSGGQWHRTDGLEFNDFGFDTNEFIAAVMTNGDWEGLIPTEATSDETPRTFRLFIPNSYDEETPIPLVIGLHGKTANANHQAWTSDFNSIAEREGIITLYPEGLNTEWNYIRGMPPGYEGIGAYDDEEFLLSLLDYISSELNIDRNRVYVTGLSNGGFMTQRLACTQQEHFAAFASVAATGTYELPGFCEGKGAVPIMYIQGTADRIVPWDGMQTQSRSGIPFWISLPMNDTMAFWAFHNECRTDELDIEDIPSVDDETRSRIIRVVDCLDYAPVQLIMVANGGHVWPGVRDIQSDLLGISTKDFNATEMIWEFFQDKSLDDRP
jgi:polyhydroxybutyrate depolymerase